MDSLLVDISGNVNLIKNCVILITVMLGIAFIVLAGSILWGLFQVALSKIREDRNRELNPYKKL